MSGDLFSIGASGLLAFQRSLNTISHNIANVNTEGYSRQTVQLATRPPEPNGFGFSGNGVDTVTIRRSYDAFVESSLRSGMSATAEFEAFHALAAQLDNVVADPDTGIHTSLQRFFEKADLQMQNLTRPGILLSDPANYLQLR